MKYVWLLVTLLYLHDAKAQIISVTNIRVSVKGESAAVAREHALEQAHELAFQKLLKEYFPDQSGPAPSQETLMDMVTDFSINQEKTTPRSYAASLTFQFDEFQVRKWLQKKHSSAIVSSSLPYKENKPLKITASYKTLEEWQQIKSSLETLPGIRRVTVFSLSPQSASLEIIHDGDVDKLQQQLLLQEILLSPQDNEWLVSSKKT